MTAIGRDYSLILLFDDPPMNATDSGKADGIDRQFQYSVVLIILKKGPGDRGGENGRQILIYQVRDQ